MNACPMLGPCDVTLTGIDETCDLTRLAALHRPGLEFGILLSLRYAGQNKRYPALSWITDALMILPPRSCALHICGGDARKAFFAHEYEKWHPFLRRVQVNGVLAVPIAEQVHGMLQTTELTIITQCCPGNEYLAAYLPSMRHQVLVDSSGGRGVTPEKWVHPSPNGGKHVGFAGGLGPMTLGEQLPLIRAVARPGWWVDMENNLRDQDDNFDVDRAAAALRIIDFVNSQEVA
ncbi:MAG: hypothetical protein ABFD94_06105 [Armatimonadia bacterium]